MLESGRASASGRPPRISILLLSVAVWVLMAVFPRLAAAQQRGEVWSVLPFSAEGWSRMWP